MHLVRTPLRPLHLPYTAIVMPLVKAGNGNATGVHSHAAGGRRGGGETATLSINWNYLYCARVCECGPFSAKSLKRIANYLTTSNIPAGRTYLPFPLWPTARTLYWGSPHLFLVAFREINSINWLSLLSIECIHKAFFREFHLFIHSHTQRHTDTHKHSHTLSHRHATVHTHRHIHLQMATTLLWLRLFFVVNAAIRCH